MSNAADVVTPYGATHVTWSYGAPLYYKSVERQHLNQVSEEWQTLTDWFFWDPKLRQWESVGTGFSSRRLKPLTRLCRGNKNAAT